MGIKFYRFYFTDGYTPGNWAEKRRVRPAAISFLVSLWSPLISCLYLKNLLFFQGSEAVGKWKLSIVTWCGSKFPRMRVESPAAQIADVCDSHRGAGFCASSHPRLTSSEAFYWSILFSTFIRACENNYRMQKVSSLMSRNETTPCAIKFWQLRS